MDFVDEKTLYTIIHLLGVALGAGGAYMSDAMFMSTIKDKVITSTEVRFLKLGSSIVWIGLLLLFVSGALLFGLDPAKYMASTKFLAKSIIVGIITLNGLIFYLVHTRRLIAATDLYLPQNPLYRTQSVSLYVSGGISMVSWTFALVLGALKSVPYSVVEILSAYGLCIALAIVVSLVVRAIHLRD